MVKELWLKRVGAFRNCRGTKIKGHILEQPKYKDGKPNMKCIFFKLWNIGEPTSKGERESSAMVRFAKIRGYLYDIILMLTTYDGKPKHGLEFA